MIPPPPPCRVCRGALQPLLDLGILALPAFPDAAHVADVPRAPLDLRVCAECGLVQLADTVHRDALYTQYWYRSSINETMQAELTSIVRAALLDVSIYPQDLVIDVGANDGYLLSRYPHERMHWEATRLAFEPAVNLQDACRKHCEILIPSYFPPTALDLDRMPGAFQRAKIVTTIAMFYDLEDPAQCVRTINHILHPEGVWILQLQDLAQMVQATAFDNICHEHLTYWSLDAIESLLDRTRSDLHVTHVEQRTINGGSLRLHIRRRVYPPDQTVDQWQRWERPLITYQQLEHFAWRVGEVRTQIQAAIEGALSAGKVIDLYGASTKANTLLQYCGLDTLQIRQAWERNPEKFGRCTATGIPIVNEQAGRDDQPDLLLAGIWQFRDSILQREAPFIDAGGAVLFPLPEVDFVRGARAATPDV